MSDGDVEFIQLPFLDRADAAARSAPSEWSDDDVLTCLHALEGRGLLVSNLTVYSASTTEYICEWVPRDDH